MVGVEGVFADVDDGFVEIHAGRDEFVESSESSEESGDFVELDDGGFHTYKFEGLITAEAEGNFLVEAVVGTRFAGVELAEIWLGDAEDAG